MTLITPLPRTQASPDGWHYTIVRQNGWHYMKYSSARARKGLWEEYTWNRRRLALADLGRFLANVVGFLQVELFCRGIAFSPRFFARSVWFGTFYFVLFVFKHIPSPTGLGHANMSTVQGVQEDWSGLYLQGMANMDMALLLNYKYCKILVVWVIFEVMFFIFLCKQAMLHQIFGLLCGESVFVRVVLHVTLQNLIDL